MLNRRIFFIISTLSLLLFANDIDPIPLKIGDVNPQKVALGHKLFFDPILSKDGTVSCVNCHILEDGGDDNIRFSIGINGQLGNINSTTVLNARYNFVQFWNGRAKNLKEQAVGPIENPVEMGNNFPNLIKVLKKSSYKKEFDSVYKNGITKENIIDAIAEYEKTLITPDAPFDKYLRGDKNALLPIQKEGYELFKTKGCISCHNGINIGGNLYAKFGVFKEAKSKSLGRYEVTKNRLDKYFFKVPTLRNIALTSPYLHDGRYKTLNDVVKFMLENQLGREAKKSDIDKIVAFLLSLSGKLAKP
ncbi:MAG: cytochrome-c peroxidase [Sulfurospirillum sp.]